MLRKKLNEINFVVFDVETTGFKPAEEQIIEIGAVKTDIDGNVLETFSEFVSLYKKKEVPQKITELTTITTEELLEKGKNINTVMDDFLKFIDNCILVAQNAKFDMSFLAGYFLEEKRQTFSSVCLDTINFAKIIFPLEDSYRLAHLVELFDVDYASDSHHRADYDAKITADVFHKELSKLEIDENTTVGELIKLEQVELITSKQESFLNSLIEKNNILLNSSDFYTKHTASAHIDIILNLKN